jgi:hypothetical protein
MHFGKLSGGGHTGPTNSTSSGVAPLVILDKSSSLSVIKCGEASHQHGFRNVTRAAFMRVQLLDSIRHKSIESVPSVNRTEEILVEPC